MALQRERRLPSSVRGPVLLSAFSRLASICLMVVIRGQVRPGLDSARLVAVGRPLTLAWDVSAPRGSWQSQADRFFGFATTSLRCLRDAVRGDDRGRAGP